LARKGKGKGRGKVKVKVKVKVNVKVKGGEIRCLSALGRLRGP